MRASTMKGALLIVFVISPEAAQPETQAFAAAARDVLGADAQVRIVAVPADVPDKKVEDTASGANAVGAMELSWTEDHSRALVHCYIAGESRWIDRSISFGEAEDESERGRMLGYAVASMFLTHLPHADGPDATRAVDHRENSPPLSSAVGVTDSTAPRPGDDAPDSPAGNAHWFDFGGLLSHGLGGEADAVGVTAALHFWAVGPVSARLGVGGRTGEIPAAPAHLRSLQGSAGAALNLFDTARFTTSLRGELIGSWLEVGHLSADDPDVARRSRWLFGSDAVFTGALKLSAGAALFLGAGIEVMFGRTDIYTQGVRAATIPPLRLIAEFGLRSAF